MTKKFKCQHCGAIIECDEFSCVATCNCGKVKTTNGTIVEGVIGVDYLDVGPKLLHG